MLLFETSAASSQTDWSGKASSFSASLLKVLVDGHTKSKWITVTSTTCIVQQQKNKLFLLNGGCFIVLLWFVIRGKQSDKGEEYSLKWQLVLSKYLFPVTAERNPFEYTICTYRYEAIELHGCKVQQGETSHHLFTASQSVIMEQGAVMLTVIAMQLPHPWI